MEQAQRGTSGSLPVDKRTKEHKEAHKEPTKPRIVKVGFVQIHGTLFFGGKNFKERIDTRTDKCRGGGALEMEYDRDEKELTLRGEGTEMSFPSTTVFGYCEERFLPTKVTATSGIGANTSINAQVSGPHDHVFAGAGAGQTGVGNRVK